MMLFDHFDSLAARRYQYLYQPTEMVDIYGSSEKAKRELNWQYDLEFSTSSTEYLRRNGCHMCPSVSRDHSTLETLR